MLIIIERQGLFVNTTIMSLLCTLIITMLARCIAMENQTTQICLYGANNHPTVSRAFEETFRTSPDTMAANLENFLQKLKINPEEKCGAVARAYAITVKNRWVSKKLSDDGLDRLLTRTCFDLDPIVTALYNQQ